MTTDELHSRILDRRSFLCVGLDTDYQRLPDCIKGGSAAQSVLRFNKEIIDATAPFCISYKPNLAFYEALGPEGMKVLEDTVDHIRSKHPDKFIIADAKRGDIGNTARLYARTFFETYDFDAVTLSPYMGVETVLPFLDYPGRYAIVVALSSNPGSSDFEQQAVAGAGGYSPLPSEDYGKFRSEGSTLQPLYRTVMEKMMEVSTPENLMFVAGATKAEVFKEIRTFCPDNFLLVPGVGAQGGSAEEVIANGANSRGGLIINSSRAIIYASSGKDFAEAAAKAAAVTARL